MPVIGEPSLGTWPLIAATLLVAMTPVSAALAPSKGTSVQLAGHRFQQIALTTTDLARATRFYRDTLGLPFLFETNNMVFFDVAGTRLMIALDPKRPEASATSILYFDAPEFDASLARLRATGAVLEGPVETVQSDLSGDLKLQQFVDPDGNHLAIMGKVPRR